MLQEEKETTQDIIEEAWRKLLALAAATPPEQATSEVGTKYPYCDFLADKLRQLRRELEDQYWHMVHIEECEEVLRTDPDSVTEG